MTVAFNALPDAQLAYSAIFLCIASGFVCLKLVYRKAPGPAFWGLGFGFNAAGFLFWSGFLGLPATLGHLLGELCHVAGFFLIVFGALRSRSLPVKRAALSIASLSWLALWLAAILSLRDHLVPAAIALKLLRAVLFIIAGIALLREPGRTGLAGRRIAAGSLVLWGAYIVVSSFVAFNPNLFYGFLVGFQVLAAFGMVAMVMDTIRAEAERNERNLRQLEGILPICSYCKKIRDGKNEWHVLEAYIEKRSEAEFSHGICPECFEKHRPDRG